MCKKFRETHLFAFLNRFDRDGKPLDTALSDYLRAHKSIGAHDRRFLGDTAYSLIRWKGLLDYQLKKTPSWEERFALWQRLDLTAHGITSLPHDLPPWVRSGASPWFFQELASCYGDLRAFELCRALNEPAPLTVRANLLKTTRGALLDSWKGSFDVEPCSRAPAGIRFNQKTALTALAEFKLGFFEIQDEGSQLVADLAKPLPGEQILDYCSGSGGKSLAIAPRLSGRGQIYLHDIRPGILQEARKRLRRAGIQNAQFLLPDHPRLPSLKNKMDWVLADVPCSGSGTYRRNPDMKWKADTAMLDRLATQQQEIFCKATDFVKPGGKIVYATCSIFKKENENQIDYFLKTLPLVLEEPPLAILPERGGPDGFFAAIFSRIR